MPEGPEIRRQAERVAEALAGRPASGVYFAHAHLAPWQEVLTGKRVVADPPRRAAALKRRGLSRSRYRHAAFRRTGGDCYRCGTPLERHTVAGRRLDLCPACQPAPS